MAIFMSSETPLLSREIHNSCDQNNSRTGHFVKAAKNVGKLDA